MPSENDHLIADIFGTGHEIETDFMPTARALRAQAARQFRRVEQQQSLRDVAPEPPSPGESLHVVSEAKFDFWTWVPVMIDWLGTTEDFYCSTWTLSRQNATDFFQVWDAGKIPPGKAAFLTGTYFKRRETSVYAFLLEGIRQRGGRFVAFQNHAKVLLLRNRDRGAYITVEGSANLNANPRLEQYVITNDLAVWDFHRQWMDEVLAR